MTAIWAGKRLSDEEELSLRRVVSLARGCGDEKTAVRLERFLPENDRRWTPDELELGAHLGPEIDTDVEVTVEEQ